MLYIGSAPGDRVAPRHRADYRPGSRGVKRIRGHCGHLLGIRGPTTSRSAHSSSQRSGRSLGQLGSYVSPRSSANRLLQASTVPSGFQGRIEGSCKFVWSTTWHQDT